MASAVNKKSSPAYRPITSRKSVPHSSHKHSYMNIQNTEIKSVTLCERSPKSPLPMGEINSPKNKKAHWQWAKFCVYKGMKAKSRLMITQEKLTTRFAEIQKELFSDAHKQKPKDGFLAERNLLRNRIKKLIILWG